MDESGLFRGVHEQLPICRQVRSYSQALEGTVVDLIGNGIQLLLALAQQVCALWKVLAHQAIGVLVAASLPQTVRIAEVHGHAGVSRQLFV
jgi:hypothetical protein